MMAGHLLNTYDFGEREVMCGVELDDRTLVFGLGLGQVVILNKHSGEHIKTLKVYLSVRCALKLRSKPSTLLLGDPYGRVSEWNTSDWCSIGTFEDDRIIRHSMSILGICELSDGETVISSSADGTMKRWDLNTRRCIMTFSGHTRPVRRTIQLSPNTIVSTALDATMRVWDLSTGDCLKLISMKGLHKEALRDFLVMTDGTFVTGSDALRAWNER